MFVLSNISEEDIDCNLCRLMWYESWFSNKNCGKPAVHAFWKEFGTRFILFPNPVYGNWEHAIFTGSMPEEGEILEKLRGF